MISMPLTKAAGLVAALTLVSVAFASPPASAGNTVTREPGALAQKASDLLGEVHQDAQGVLKSADTLEGYNRVPFLVDWRVDGSTLDRMCGQINKMEKMVSELRSMEGNLPHAQQAEINQLTPAMLELTDTAQMAINYLKNDQDRTMFSQYMSYANEMYTEAARIEHSTALPPAK